MVDSEDADRDDLIYGKAGRGQAMLGAARLGTAGPGKARLFLIGKQAMTFETIYRAAMLANVGILFVMAIAAACCGHWRTASISFLFGVSNLVIFW